MVVELRDKWGSKAEFILAIVGYGVGLGNIWRFPYLCYKSGGGAFLVPYLIMLFFCGVPLFFMEAALGQFSSSAVITIFEKLAPALKGCAYAAIVVNIIASMQYNLLISYPILFLIDSFQKVLPWKTCDNSWNTLSCVKITGDVMNISKEFKSSADEYFHNKILEISTGPEEFGSIVTPLAIVNILSWAVLFLCLCKGIKSLGKIVYFTASFPYLMLFILFIRGVTLPGAWEGIKAYIIPEWKELFNLNVWADAAVQIFFSLGPGWGGIVNMASYNPFRNNIQIDSTLLPIFNSFTSIFAGFVVFSVLGYLSHQTGIPVKEVANEGPALAFVTYPEALGLLPFPQFFSICFFLMLYFLGIDSCLVQIETCITCITDEWPQLRRRKHWVAFATILFLALGSLLFVFQNGIYLITIFDYFAYSLTVILICILEIVMVCYCYGIEQFEKDLGFMLNKQTVGSFWIVCWKYVSPAVLVFIFFTVMIFSSNLTYNGVQFPAWCISLGWFSSILSLLIIPGYFLYKMLQFDGDCKTRVQKCFKETDWGPAEKPERTAWELEVKVQELKV